MRSICELKALGFHITLRYAECWTRIGFQPLSDVTNNARWTEIGFQPLSDVINNASRPRLFKSDFSEYKENFDFQQ